LDREAGNPRTADQGHINLEVVVVVVVIELFNDGIPYFEPPKNPTHGVVPRQPMSFLIDKVRTPA
jgi:hypothetical protein